MTIVSYKSYANLKHDLERINVSIKNNNSRNKMDLAIKSTQIKGKVIQEMKGQETKYFYIDKR